MRVWWKRHPNTVLVLMGVFASAVVMEDSMGIPQESENTFRMTQPSHSWESAQRKRNQQIRYLDPHIYSNGSHNTHGMYSSQMSNNHE